MSGFMKVIDLLMLCAFKKVSARIQEQFQGPAEKQG